MDGDGFVVADALTENTKDDAAVLPDLLGQIDGQVRRFTGDGAYDPKSVYEQIGAAGTEFGGIPIFGEQATTGGALQGYLRWVYYF